MEAFDFQSQEKEMADSSEDLDAQVTKVKELFESKFQDRDLAFENLKEFSSGEKRFLYGFSFPHDPSEKEGFIKGVALQNEDGLPTSPHLQLERESAAMDIVSKMGIETLKQFDSYQNINDEYAVMHVEALHGSDGDLLSSPELVAVAPPEYALWAAKAIKDQSGRELSENIDTSALKYYSAESGSHEMLWEEWNLAVKTITERLVSEEKENFQQIVDEIRKEVDALIVDTIQPDKKYFVHNDMAVNNMFYNTKEKKALVLDYEHAGVVHSRALALIKDVANYYGRGWPNPEFQAAFLRSCKEEFKDEKNLRSILRGSVVFGTFLARFAMDDRHIERPMAKALLKNFETNLGIIDE